jgi:hypothetical protein
MDVMSKFGIGLVVLGFVVLGVVDNEALNNSSTQSTTNSEVLAPRLDEEIAWDFGPDDDWMAETLEAAASH